MPWKATVLLVSSMLGNLGNSQAETVYQWVDADGVRHFADHPPALDVGERIRIRAPNLARPFRPLPVSERKARATSAPRPGAARRPLRVPRDATRTDPRCREIRIQARALRDQRRKGYTIDEERTLDRRARALLEAMRLYCD